MPLILYFFKGLQQGPEHIFVCVCVSVAGQSFRLHLLSLRIRLTLSDRPYSKQGVWTVAQAVRGDGSIRWEEYSDGGHWKMYANLTFLGWFAYRAFILFIYLFIYLTWMFTSIIIIIAVVHDTNYWRSVVWMISTYDFVMVKVKQPCF